MIPSYLSCVMTTVTCQMAGFTLKKNKKRREGLVTTNDEVINLSLGLLNSDPTIITLA